MPSSPQAGSSGCVRVSSANTDVPVGELLQTMQRVYDEPFADSSNIATYVISMLARKHIPVVLSGDGGDELLAGYTFWYHPLLMMEPGFFTMMVGRLSGQHAWWNRKMADGFVQAGLGLRNGFSGIAEAHAAQKKYFSDRELDLFGIPRVAGDGASRSGATLDDALRSDLTNYMPGDILVKVDRAAMAHGLELRAPFLDVDFASFCIGLPWQLKMNLDQDKYIMRKACGDLWTDDIRVRGKEGFGAPVQRWLKRPDVALLKEKHLVNPDSALYAVLPPAHVRQHIASDSYKTWTLLVLAMWLETHPLR